MRESTFRTKLNSILKDNSIERYIGGKTRGKINTKRMYKINNSKKIFKLKEERKGKDYSITLLLDASGSMEDEARNVSKSVKHIGEALNNTDIPFSIYSFSCVTRLIKSFDEKYVYSQVDKLYKDTFRLKYYNCFNCKSFDVNVKDWQDRCPKCSKLGLLGEHNGSTFDSLALHIVGNEVHKKYTKNIIIVITDGDGDNLENHPCTYDKTKIGDLKNNVTVIKRLHKKYDDLILLGISVDGDYTSNVYGKQHSLCIDEPSEIFDAVAKLLSRHIKRG